MNGPPVFEYRVQVFVPVSKDEDDGTVMTVDVRAYNASDAWLQALIAIEGKYGLGRVGHAMARVVDVQPRPMGPNVLTVLRVHGRGFADEVDADDDE